MDNDLVLQLFIKSILEGKGFEDAQARIGVVANEAALAAPKLKKAGDETKKMGESFGGTRGPVADLTRILLQNVGVTGAAGEAAKAAGIGMYFMEGAAKASTVAIATTVASIALLLPSIIKWIAGTEDQTEAQRKQTEELVAALPELEELAAKVGKITEAQQRQLDAARKAAQLGDITRRDAMVKSLEDEASAYDEISRQVETLDATIARNFGSILNAPKALREQFEDLTAKQSEQRNAMEVHAATVAELNDAIAAGTTLEAGRAGALKDAAAAEREAAAAAKSHLEFLDEIVRLEGQQAQERLDAAGAMQEFKEGFEHDVENDLKGKKSTQKERLDALQKESERLLALGKVKRDQAAIDALVARQKRDQVYQGIADATYAVGVFSSLFGQNKGIAIAEAVANTAAAAVAAGRDTHGPFWVRLAAIAAVAAAGAAQVMTIRNAKPVGFDDPFSDFVARQLGRGSAVDFVREFGNTFVEGVRAGMAATMAGGARSVTYLTDRSRRIEHFHAEGVIGPNRTSTMKWLRRQLRVGDQVEARSTVGRPR